MYIGKLCSIYKVAGDEEGDRESTLDPQRQEAFLMVPRGWEMGRQARLSKERHLSSTWKG